MENKTEIQKIIMHYNMGYLTYAGFIHQLRFWMSFDDQEALDWQIKLAKNQSDVMDAEIALEDAQREYDEVFSTALHNDKTIDEILKKYY